MITRHRVSLNGIQLDQVDSRIVIQNVSENAGKEQVTATARAGRWGQRMTQRRRDFLDVTVTFGIDVKKRGMQTRETILEAVNAWAKDGGLLRLNYRENRRLRVVQVDPPGAGDPWNWTGTYNLTFRAYASPWWEEDTEYATCTVEAGTSGSERITIGGKR